METEAGEVKNRYLRYLEAITGSLEDKKRYRRYKARIEDLPSDHRTAAKALQRYLQYFGPGTSDNHLTMLDDLADLFEQAVADGTSVRDIVGDDPVEFAEVFLRNYPEGSWIARERARLAEAIDRAAGGAL
ncbi:DUF1048 domain-containing protein [Amycolatopsis benzoatilytica]|uniref:DUF1048 domain-containing protein n=1 Tax=Amycolatopsis benzoatilytica TaxID=346045 RepID=UPI00036A0A3E|nr:DUF1048 domain-containing protein [Amycolatopsis benzoatilytica]